MPSRKVPRYCLHRATSQAYIHFGGRDHYLGKHGTPESQRLYAEKIAEWQRLQTMPPSDLTISDLSLMYLARCKVHYRKNGEETTEVQSVRDALKRLNRLHWSVLAIQFTPKLLVQVQNAMIEEGVLCRNTINSHIGRIRRMFRWAVGGGLDLLPESVYSALKTVYDLQKGRTNARESRPVKSVSDERVNPIETFVSRQVWGLIQFQRMTGARPGEALIIRRCDIDMSGHVWEYRPESHKTEHHDKERVILIGPQGKAVLMPFMKANPEEYLFSPRDALSEFVGRSYRSGARVRRDAGEHYTPHSYASAIRRACERAFGMPDELRDIPNALKEIPEEQRDGRRTELKDAAKKWRKKHCWAANRLRHNFATVVRRKAGLETARVSLGHSSAVTSEVYAERDLEAARNVIAAIG